MKTLYMETTEISPEKSASEITMALVQAGARSVSCSYENQKIVGLRWTMIVAGQEVPFIMPARVDPVYQLLRKRFKGAFCRDTQINMQAKAERVAWRQLHRWVFAQLAMIETGMVSSGEVFMPYVEFAPGQTMFQVFESRQLALPAPEKVGVAK